MFLFTVSTLFDLTLHHLGLAEGRYRYWGDLKHLDHPPLPAAPLLLTWPSCPSPIHLRHFAHLLANHPHEEFYHFIIKGLREGFHVGYRCQGMTLSLRGGNHRSSLSNQDVVSSYIQGEVQAGRMVGPLPSSTARAVHCSPVSLVPKSRGTGHWRMIVDLSSPLARSVNAGIQPDLCTLRYSSVYDIVQFISYLGCGTPLIKVDLKNAYRMVPIHPADRWLFGLRWSGQQVYVDQALSFGLRSAPNLFSAVADAIGWALCQSGIPLFIHYLDDFLFFVHPSTSQSQQPQHILRIYDILGVPVALEKIEGPAMCVTFLGILIDTKLFEMHLPDPKVRHIQSLLTTWSHRRSGRRDEFESLRATYPMHPLW